MLNFRYKLIWWYNVSFLRKNIIFIPKLLQKYVFRLWTFKSFIFVCKLCKMFWFSSFCLFLLVYVLCGLTEYWCGTWLGLHFFLMDTWQIIIGTRGNHFWKAQNCPSNQNLQSRCACFKPKSLNHENPIGGIIPVQIKPATPIRR